MYLYTFRWWVHKLHNSIIQQCFYLDWVEKCQQDVVDSTQEDRPDTAVTEDQTEGVE